jgi:predicted TIM-barrel fold metal-dependent hydrolase
MRRLAVEEAFVTPDVVAGWKDVLGRADVEPGFAKLGVERIMFAVDYPYENADEAVRCMDVANITEDERRQIYAGNAERIFKLKA